MRIPGFTRMKILDIMLVLNASGIILGDKKVNNWFEGEIEKKYFPNIKFK